MDKVLYDYTALPKVLLEAFKTKSVHAAAGGKLPLDSNVSIDEALELYSTVRRLKPSISVEVGCAKGISTLAILQALADNGSGLHYVIDPFQANYGNAGLEMVHRAGLESYFEFHETFAEYVIPGLPTVEFGFIDASHLFDLTLVEFVLIDKKLSPNGMVGFHDLWMPSLRSVVRYILSNREYQLVHSSTSSIANKSYTLEQRLKRAAIAGLERMPYFEKIFSAELLSYPLNSTLSNLTIIKKIKNDSRDWKSHKPF